MALRISPKNLQILRSGAIGQASQFAVGASCSASAYSPGFADLDEGSTVTLRNEKETVIGTGRLGAGHWSVDACEMPFSIPKVPAANFYSIEVGHRGAQRYSVADLEKAKWVVTLSVTDAG